MGTVTRVTSTAFLHMRLALVCVLLLLSTSMVTQAFAGPHRVLIIHSYHQGLSWTDDIQAAFSTTLARSELPLEVDVKYLDVSRIIDPKVLRRNKELLQQQIINLSAGKPFDIVLVSDNAALDLLLEHRESIAGNAPVVFCGINNFSQDMLRGQSNITGVAEIPSFYETIVLASKLRPMASKLLVLAEDTPTGKANLSLLQTQSSRLSGRVEIEVLEETDIYKLEARLAGLSPEWVVLPMVRPLDENGVLSAPAASQRLSRACAVPLFVAWDFWMGHGPAAGVVVSGTSQGETAAAMASRILKGERADDIPVVRQETNVTIADNLAFTRFGMSERLLPEGAVILNAPVSFYAVNKVLFLTGGAVGLCLLLLSIFLALNVSRRKRAEALYQGQLNFVETLMRAMPAPLFYKDTQGRYLGVNPAFETLMGKLAQDFIGRYPTEVFAQEHGQVFVQRDQELSNLGDMQRYQHVMLTARGLRTLMITKAVFPDKDGSPAGVVGILDDITDHIRNEESLRESEERFRNLFENAPLAYQSLDENGRFLDVNRKWLEVLGYEDKKQVLGRWFGDILAPGYREHFDINFPIFKNACVIDGVEFEMLCTDGGRITVSFNGRVQTDSEGHFMRTHCIFTDITERNRIEEVKQKEHFINQTIIESVPGTFYMLDMKGHYVRWNAYQRDVIVGKPDNQVTTVNALDTIHPDDRSLVGAKIEAVLKNGSEEILEGRVLLHGGPAYQWMLMTGRQVFIQGNPFLIGFGIDITARKEAEASLNAIKWLVDKEVRPVLAHEASGNGDLVQLNKSRVILNAVGSDILANMVHDYMAILGTSSAVYEKNGDYAFGIFASGWCQAMDHASRRLCGCTNNTEALVSGKWLCHESCWSEASLAAMETRQPADIACKGGIRLYAVPIKSGDEVVGAINFGYGTPPRDKTVIAELAARYQVDPDALWKLSMEYEHRPDFIIDTAKQRLKTTARLIGEMVSRSMVEQDLQKATHLAETANRAKSEFLANMSHEIRTPLNGILGMLQLLQTTDPNDEQKEYLFGAIRSTNRLSRLLSDILDISRIEAGRMEIVEVEFNIKKTRDSIKELFNPEARGKGVRLEFGRDDDLPLLLIGDEARLRQILFNLVGNAIKFTEKGEIRVDASLLPNLSDSSVRVLVTVSDTGIGIPEESLKSVFEPFVQAEGSYTRRFQGAGLGLSIVRRLVKLLGGDISIDSTVGEGTTVYLSLPFKLPSGGQGQIDQEVRVIAPSAEASWRILIAEDDSVSLITAKRMLEKSGYLVTAAKNGQEALQRLTEEDFDLILMDVQMPVMDGVEATKTIRGASSLGVKSSIPIVAMTAYAMTGDKESFLAAGMDDYISKPVDKAALVEVIERVLSLKRNIQ